MKVMRGVWVAVWLVAPVLLAVLVWRFLLPDPPDLSCFQGEHVGCFSSHSVTEVFSPVSSLRAADHFITSLRQDVRQLKKEQQLC